LAIGWKSSELCLGDRLIVPLRGHHSLPQASALGQQAPPAGDHGMFFDVFELGALTRSGGPSSCAAGNSPPAQAELSLLGEASLLRKSTMAVA
jgi:hypothetical protein